MLGILSAIIGVVAKGKAAKAIAGGLSGAIATQLTSDNPLVGAFWTGVTTGALPSVQEAGVMVGQVVIGGIIGYGVTWLAPKNAVAK